MTRSGVSIGKFALVENDIKGIFADFTMRIRLVNYDPKFAYYYFRSKYFQYLIETFKKGLQNQNIFPIVVQEFPIPDISLAEQKTIVKEIKEKISEQEKITQEIAQLRKQIDEIIATAIKEVK
jgi:type I restriction enzyme S subunit